MIALYSSYLGSISTLNLSNSARSATYLASLASANFVNSARSKSRSLRRRSMCCCFSLSTSCMEFLDVVLGVAEVGDLMMELGLLRLLFTLVAVMLLKLLVIDSRDPDRLNP
uniref:Uncharacterized protein n=1 Tax=Cacopsylla melanoneura TaxID=428564 RepID=A0A8D8PQG6_9HEMI